MVCQWGEGCRWEIGWWCWWGRAGSGQRVRGAPAITNHDPDHCHCSQPVNVRAVTRGGRGRKARKRNHLDVAVSVVDLARRRRLAGRRQNVEVVFGEPSSILPRGEKLAH